MTHRKRIVLIVIHLLLRILDVKALKSASNPLLYDLYNGVTRVANTEEACEAFGGEWKDGIEPGSEGNVIESCHLAHGVLSDLNPSCSTSDLACDNPHISTDDAPTNFGGCADCHAPGIDGQLMGRNLHDAIGLAYDAGVHCDTCHKVKDVDMSQPAGFGSRLVVHRPGEPGRNAFEWDPVYYGPIIDVPNVAMASPQEGLINRSFVLDVMSMNSRLWYQIRVWIWKSGPMDCPFKVPIVSGRKARSIIQRHRVNGAICLLMWTGKCCRYCYGGKSVHYLWISKTCGRCTSAHLPVPI